MSNAHPSDATAAAKYPLVPHAIGAVLERALAGGCCRMQAEAEATARLLALRPALPVALARSCVAELAAQFADRGEAQRPPMALLLNLAGPASPEDFASLER